MNNNRKAKHVCPLELCISSSLFLNQLFGNSFH
uniref:Uncharacterized protein n=1 Tax=Anguilla anguilla TaxID=7936 RepID=A0A0E9TD41_ANGAN